jgi:hypothetical protein
MEDLPKVREDETLVFPLARPRQINRLYFKLGKPIRTSKDLVNDKDKCEEIYQEARQGVEDGIMYLKQKRIQDPYKDLIPRVLYEQNTSRKAPTFST